MTNPPLTKKTFSDTVRERLSRKKADDPSRIIDFVLDLAKEVHLDEKNAGYLIDRDLKEKIEIEARSLNALKD